MSGGAGLCKWAPLFIGRRLACARVRYQQIYAAGEFSALSPGGEFITQIAFRPDAVVGAAFSSTLPVFVLTCPLPSRVQTLWAPSLPTTLARMIPLFMVG